MSNCVDIPMNYKNDAEIEAFGITYMKNEQGFADTIDGKFIVHINREHKETEAVITFYKCPKGATGICTENPKEFIEALSCQRFLKDDTGPCKFMWFIMESFDKIIFRAHVRAGHRQKKSLR